MGLRCNESLRRHLLSVIGSSSPVVVFLRREFANESPRDLGNLSRVVFDFEVRAKLLWNADSLRDGYGRNLVCFFDRCMWFKEGKAVVELDIERVFPVQIARVFHGRILRLPKWFLCGDSGFHNRPSLFSSSITLINFRLGFQPSIPRICSYRVGQETGLSRHRRGHVSVRDRR